MDVYSEPMPYTTAAAASSCASSAGLGGGQTSCSAAVPSELR